MSSIRFRQLETRKLNVSRHGILAHMDSYGYADLERQALRFRCVYLVQPCYIFLWQVPMRPDTIVRLYSMTKSIISVATGDL